MSSEDEKTLARLEERNLSVPSSSLDRLSELFGVVIDVQLTSHEFRTSDQEYGVNRQYALVGLSYSRPSVQQVESPQ